MGAAGRCDVRCGSCGGALDNGGLVSCKSIAIKTLKHVDALGSSAVTADDLVLQLQLQRIACSAGAQAERLVHDGMRWQDTGAGSGRWRKAGLSSAACLDDMYGSGSELGNTNDWTARLAATLLD